MGRLHDWEEFSNIIRDGGDLRIEEVISANRIFDLFNVNLTVNKTCRILLENERIIRVHGEWSQYIEENVSVPLKRIRDIMDSVVERGIFHLKKEDIQEFHAAETRIAYFLDPQRFKLFDYNLAKKLIDKGVIRLTVFHHDLGHDDFDEATAVTTTTVAAASAAAAAVLAYSHSHTHSYSRISPSFALPDSRLLYMKLSHNIFYFILFY